MVQDNPFYGCTLTPNLTPNLGSFLLLKKSSFNSQSAVKITPKIGLILLLTWVVFTLFWSFFKSENGVKTLGTGLLLFGVF